MNNPAESHAKDRIEKHIVLKAAPSRVWQALANAEEFGQWFGVALKGKSFAAGKDIRGQVLNAGYEHVVWNAHVQDMQPERLFSFRWHPGAVDPNVDYSQEPETLVEFKLQEAEGRTRLTLSESGFDKIPKSRRETAYRGNDAGWDKQMENIREYLAVH